MSKKVKKRDLPQMWLVTNYLRPIALCDTAATALAIMRRVRGDACFQRVTFYGSVAQWREMSEDADHE